MDIIQVFQEKLKTLPLNTIAVETEHNKMTYFELDRLSTLLANHLVQQGIKAGSIIAIYMEKSAEFIVTLMGILKCGCSYLPIDSSYPEKRIQCMLNISGASEIICMNKNDNLNSTIPQYLYGELTKECYSEYRWDNDIQRDLAYIIFTSGSTGNPKGIMIKHSSVVNLVEGLNDVISKMSVIERIGFLAPVVFDMSVGQIFYSILTGKTLIIIPDYIKKDPFKLAMYLSEKKIEMCDITPQHLRIFTRTLLMKKDSTHYLPTIFLSAGEALPIEVVKAYYSLQEAKDSFILNCYGPAEACVYATYNIITDAKARQMEKMTVGSCLKNTEIKILNEKGELCKDEIGEIYISGKGLAEGYINDEALTQKAFIKSPFDNRRLYKTGDLGRWDKAGELVFEGRVDNQVKVFGHRIELDEIENNISNIQGIYQCKVILNKANNCIVAYYKAKEAISEENIKSELRKNLPYYMIPNKCIQIENFETTINGKIDTFALLKSENRNEDILNICRVILQDENISYEDNFFQAGGTSFRAMELSLEIYERMGINIEISDIYKSNTIRDISNIIEILKRKKYEKTSLSIPDVINKAPSSSFQKLLFKSEKIGNAKRDYYKKNSYPTYNIIYSAEVNVRLKIDYLKKALQWIIRHQNAFELYFVREDNNIFAKAQSVCLEECFEYIVSSNELSREYVKTYAKDFDIGRTPLFQVILFEHEFTHKQVILLNMHHAIFDYYSVRLFLKNLFMKYDELVNNTEENNEQKLRGDFLNYLYEDSKKDKKKCIDFWCTYYKNRPKSIKLPGDKMEVNRIKKFDIFVDADFRITSERLNKIKAFCKRLEISTFIFFSSLFSLMLGNMVGSNDVILGTYLPGRSKDNISVMGMLIRMVGIRYIWSKRDSYRTYLMNQQCSFRNVMEQQDIDHLDLYQEFPVEILEKGELFSIIFNYVQQIELTIKDMSIKAVEIGEEPERLPFSLKMFETTSDVTIKCKFVDKYYSLEYIKTIITQYIKLIDEVLENENKIIEKK